MQMVDRDGNLVEVPDVEAGDKFRSGQYGFQEGAKIPVADETGTIGTIDAAQAPAAFGGGGVETIAQSDVDAAANEKKYGGLGGGAASFGIGAGNALALGAGKGIATQLAGAFGGEEAAAKTREAIRGYTEANPKSNIAGEVVGTVAPLLVGDVGGLVGTGVRGVGRGVRAVDSLGGLAEAGTRALVGEGGGVLAGAARKAAAFGARGATEGAVYGAGGAYSDTVLANEDLTAERLMSGAGHGALFGGTIGAGLGAGSSMIEHAAEKVMPMVRDAVEEFAQERAFKAAGGLKTWARKAEARAGGAEEIGKDLLARGHIKPGASVDQIAQTVERDAAETGQKLGNMMKEIDSAAVAKGEGNLVDGSSIIKRAYDEIITPRLNNPASRDVGEQLAKRIEPFVEEFAGKEVGHAKLWDIRKALDERIKWDARGANPATDALKEFRHVLEDELTTSADRAAKNLGISETFAKDWKETKRLYSSLRFASDMANDGAAGKLGNNWASLTDQMAGGFGALMHGPMALLHPGAAASGLLTAAAHKIMRERGSSVLASAADRLSKFGAVAEQSAAIDKKVGEAVDKFLSRGAATPAKVAGDNPDRIGARGAGVANAVASQAPIDMGKPAKTLDGQFHQATRAVARLASQAEEVRAHTERTLEPVTRNAPGVALVIQNKQAKAVDFLRSKLPPQAAQPPLTTHPARGVADVAKAKFMRSLRAVQQPLSVVEDMQKGKLSAEGVEALKAVYPETYKDVKTKVMDRVTALAEKGEDVPYQQKLQIGRLFGVAVDPTQSPAFTKAIGELFASQNGDTAKPPDQNQGPPGGGGTGGGSAHKVDTAGAMETRTQQLEKGLG